jgi:RimJ/RimL family protein N-acetyltransferase
LTSAQSVSTGGQVAPALVGVGRVAGAGELVTVAPSLWPLFGLRLSTRGLELAPVADGDLDELARLAATGVHDPDVSPFANPWTDRHGEEFELAFAQYFWRQRASWTPSAWILPFTVRVAGRIVGVQQIEGVDFPVRRTVGSGSWVARSEQGRGIGTAMRAAVLDFAFHHLQAEQAVTGAYEYNHASIRVSEKLGYARNGERRDTVRGRPARALLFRLERETWLRRGPSRLEVSGFGACRGLFEPA